MTEPLYYTLLGDGASDRCLTTIIDWVLKQIPEIRARDITSQVADLRSLRVPATELADRMEKAWKQFPCEVLFVHRDAEGASLEDRIEEIAAAARQANLPPHVPIVPVRMTEAWLLIDEGAIRRAADNPNGREPLDLPPRRKIERIADPKAHLHACLVHASQQSGRHLDQFRRKILSRVQQVAMLIDDFSPLRELSAFQLFEETTQAVIAGLLSRLTIDLSPTSAAPPPPASPRGGTARRRKAGR